VTLGMIKPKEEKEKKMKNTMKKACCAGLCLALAGNGASQGWDDYFKATSEKEIASRKEEFKDPDALKGALKKKLTSFSSAHPFYDINDFKQRFDVKDEDIRVALMGTYRESAHRLATMSREDNPDFFADCHGCMQAVHWMGIFADEPMKLFLLERARDGDIQLIVRSEAIKAYLRCADAQEAERIKPYLRELVLDNAAPSLIRNVALATYVRCAGVREARDIFTTFLAGKETLPDYVMDAALELRHETDEAKREVVRAFLWVAAAQAEDWQLFTRLDNILIARNDTAYFRSQQRLALLERHSISEPMDLPAQRA